MNLALPTVLFAAVCGVPLLAPQDPAKPPPPPAPETAAKGTAAKIDASRLKELEWLCGTWVLRGDEVETEEHWRPLRGSSILGSSHTFTPTQTTFFEHLRIAATKDTIEYIAQPLGRAPTVFPIRKLEKDVVEFANAKHDHPQLIRYERTDDGITATVSLMDGSRSQQFAFVEKR
jgi:hypothetical protein